MCNRVNICEATFGSLSVTLCIHKLIFINGVRTERDTKKTLSVHTKRQIAHGVSNYGSQTFFCCVVIGGLMRGSRLCEAADGRTLMRRSHAESDGGKNLFSVNYVIKMRQGDVDERWRCCQRV